MDALRFSNTLYRTATAWAENSTCGRGKVGAVLFRHGRPLLSTFNGAPEGADHCLDVGCDLQVVQGFESCVRAVHAEENIITFAAKYGIATDGASIFCTHAACYTCARLMKIAGIVSFIYVTPYKHSLGLDYLLRHEVKVIKFDPTLADIGDALKEASQLASETELK